MEHKEPAAANAPEHFCTYFPRALKEWLKDLAARWSSVCKNTSIFRGLKASPSSEEEKQSEEEEEEEEAKFKLFLFKREGCESV